jgi:tetratricopeptide (TPR) repeat protein
MALAAPTAISVNARILAQAVLLACAIPEAASAMRDRASSEPCAVSAVECDRDSSHARIVSRARGAFEAREWNQAADLWRSALLIDGRAAEHWLAFANALTGAERHREAVAAYERAIQLDAKLVRDATWSIARSYAAMGNDRQAIRWLDQAVSLGIRGYEELWSSPLFDRYRGALRIRQAKEARRPTYRVTKLTA